MFVNLNMSFDFSALSNVMRKKGMLVGFAAVFGDGREEIICFTVMILKPRSF
jgi:hypothetical protein